jgi:hypothetical protein
MLIRLTTRRWLAAVALAALLLAGALEAVRLRRLAREYRLRADHYAGLKTKDLELLELLEKYAESTRRLESADRKFAPLNEETIETVRRYRRRFETHTRLEDKYRHASGRPWVSVPPDPPVPN